ncbi:microcin C ABC transporter permease YejB [Candidatus Nucleicultrix amoebiphila]|jgi:microcin C transport system permease protein|uniref:Microcin ABC transporter permease n=1 Tax=Candidatus Nucleicultrix amoebiphila FS5 TaxID=1414854 RepID=A0A1W6N472_9PROT|nr:microcin C ABC transporter permease YejB [Candidatus Nucleicultrix amoebiphila]ARN84644.1 microcin ABC transporter permease [Candidatus Nucleicultrix amoebiphila FS5]
MISYALRRFLLLIPTLFGIILINFIIIQAAPGGPVEQMIAKIRGTAVGATARFAGEAGDLSVSKIDTFKGEEMASKYSGSRGLDPEFIKQIEKMYGFDKPAYERFFILLKNYVTFNLGQSYFRDISVVDLIKEKLPVSLSLGLWSTLIIYLVSIPLGIRKAVRDGSNFDVWSSTVIIIAYAIPSFLFAILLIVFLCGGSFWSIFPLRGLVSDNWATLSLGGKILDYFKHITLPIFALVISGFANLTFLTKNAFLEEINKQYVITARAKGLSERKILYEHIFRNAMLVVVAGLPAAVIHIFFTGSLLIEVIFSLDGIGLLSFETALNRDYPVVFGTLYIYTLVGLSLHIISDLAYMFVDPRIDFERRVG